MRLDPNQWGWCRQTVGMFKTSSRFRTKRKMRYLFVICVSCLSLSYCLVFSLQPCGHLQGKDLPPVSLKCDVILCLCHLSIRCPGQLCCSIVLIPNLCLLAYFETWCSKELSRWCGSFEVTISTLIAASLMWEMEKTDKSTLQYLEEVWLPVSIILHNDL